MKNTLIRISHQLGLASSAVALPRTYRRPGEVRSLKWTVLNRRRSVPHLGRKFYHMLNGLTCFALYAFVLDRTQALWALAAVGGTFVGLDLVRLRFPKANELTLRLFGGIMRREELKSVSGNSFFVAGLVVVVFFFPKPIALLSVLFLALGDPAAAVIGTLFGRTKLVGGKSLEGALANCLVCGTATLVAAHFLFHWELEKAICLAIVGGLISTISELIPLPLDDNFTIPVLSAVQLSLFFLMGS